MQTAVSACLAVARRYRSRARVGRSARPPTAKPGEFHPRPGPGGLSLHDAPHHARLSRAKVLSGSGGDLHAGGDRESLTVGTSRLGPGRPRCCG